MKKGIQCWVVVSENKEFAEFKTCSTRREAIIAKKEMQDFDIKNIKIKKAVLIYE